jgi:hypothetical protein
MSQSRREFICIHSVVGTGVILHRVFHPTIASASSDNDRDEVMKRCPYFSQPLLCGGSDPKGSYPCDK